MAIRVSREDAKKLGIKTPKRRHKYGARATVVDGITFRSKHEATRYSELKLLERAGTVRNLRLQPAFMLHAQGGMRVCEYHADFDYDERIDDGDDFHWEHVVEDAKGVRTPVYKLKRAWLRAEYGIEIRET